MRKGPDARFQSVCRSNSLEAIASSGLGRLVKSSLSGRTHEPGRVVGALLLLLLRITGFN